MIGFCYRTEEVHFSKCPVFMRGFSHTPREPKQQQGAKQKPYDKSEGINLLWKERTTIEWEAVAQNALIWKRQDDGWTQQGCWRGREMILKTYDKLIFSYRNPF